MKLFSRLPFPDLQAARQVTRMHVKLCTVVGCTALMWQDVRCAVCLLLQVTNNEWKEINVIG